MNSKLFKKSYIQNNIMGFKCGIIGLPNVGSLFKASGTVTVMFNTTMQDVVFEIPDSFLAVLDGDELPGFTKAESDQPATFTIFSGAPSMKGERDPNA